MVGVLLILCLYQIPAAHTVNIGGYDTAYVQGFYDTEYTVATSPPYLQGSDGSVRWTHDRAAILFPQLGLPTQVTLRLCGWRPPNQPQPRVSLWLNGRQLLTEFVTSTCWEEHTVVITSDLLKLNDVFIEIRAETTTLPADGRSVGVLVDAVKLQTTALPLRPYPAQIVFGALACGLLALGVRKRKTFVFGVALIGAAFLCLYRLQPPLYPYPLRMLMPGICSGLALWLIVQHAQPLADHLAPLARFVAPLGVTGWVGTLLWIARDHVTLSRPGVENDFRVFATRRTLATIFHADPFYNLGYPLLLWLARPLSAQNAFLAGRLVAALSGGVLLLATYLLARVLFEGRGLAWLALLMVGLSPLVVQYGLYVGSDMPFAALGTLALALTARAATTTLGSANTTPSGALHAEAQPLRDTASLRRYLNQSAPWLLAGCIAGCTFLIRHIGLLLLPWGLILIGVTYGSERQRRVRVAGFFTLGFLLAAAPQLLVNTLQTGQPLYNAQAKNVWLAVYGNTDWSRWYEAPDSITLTDVILRDPLRFLVNWWGNLTAFTGRGAEDTSEFGRAIQLRLLAWPANWLALSGLLGWLWVWLRQRTFIPQQKLQPSLLLFLMLYVCAAAMAFALPRFFLLLIPIYALAGAWTIGQLIRRAQHQRMRLLVGAFLLLSFMHLGNIGIGAHSVLDNQPSAEVAVAQLVRATLGPNDTLLADIPDRVPLDKYSAIAHYIVPWPSAPDPATALAQARAQGVTYLLWPERAGNPPLPMPITLVGRAGGYGLYRIEGFQ